jgi:2-polyprenyl-3-methyl-5-hydroxy-6-metoxy-1,4-benzoquinol methylase
MTMVPKCYVCHSSNTITESFALGNDNKVLDALVCEECGHATRMNQPDFAANLENQKDRFDKVAKKPVLHLPWYNRTLLLKSQLERFCKGGKILDIGCGSGRWLAALGRNWDKYGVEVSHAAAENARRFACANVFCGPVEEYEAELESFDVVTAFALIEHLNDPRVLLQWVHAHLKAGGISVLMTGDRQSRVARQLGYKWPQYAKPVHLHFFSARSLACLLVEYGFVIRHREWRYMGYGKRSLIKSCLAKTREILGLLDRPNYDHLYVYAQKPSE